MIRHSLFALILSPILLVAVACGSDSTDEPSNSTGGTAGAGGSGGAGGTGGTAGEAGSGGSGGAAGQAGSGGTAGEAGSGGSGGSGVGTCTAADGDPGDIGPAPDCHQLPNCAADVTFQTASGTAPTPAGGTVADGLYALTAAKVYGMAAPPGVTVKVTQFKDGDTMYSVAKTPNSEGRTMGTVAFSGTDVVLTQTCPGSGEQSRKYTATSTQLLDFDTDEDRTIVYEYTLVP